MMKILITKWISNSTAVLKTIPKEELSPYEVMKDSNITFGDPDIISQTTKCLVMTFCPRADIFNHNSYEELSALEGKGLKLTK